MLEVLGTLGLIGWVFAGGCITLPTIYNLENEHKLYSIFQGFKAYKDVLVKYFFKDRNTFGVILGVFLSLVTSSGILILLICKFFSWFQIACKFIYKLGEKRG